MEAINTLQIDITSIKNTAEIIKIMTDDWPALFNKISIKPIRSRCLIRWQEFSHLVNVLMAKRGNQTAKIIVGIQKIGKVEKVTSEAIDT